MQHDCTTWLLHAFSQLLENHAFVLNIIVTNSLHVTENFIFIVMKLEIQTRHISTCNAPLTVTQRLIFVHASPKAKIEKKYA